MSIAAIASGVTMPDIHNNPDSTSSDRLTLNLHSNNPFRNRAASPSQLSPHSASGTPTGEDPRSRMSNNPFLDNAEMRNTTTIPAANAAVNVPSDIFNDLSLLDKPVPANAPPPAYTSQPRMPPPGAVIAPPRGPPRQPSSPRRNEPERRHRPRGMSETSVTQKERQDRRERERERSDQPPRTESEERRRQERRKRAEEAPRTESEERRRSERRKEREERYKREKERAARKGRRPQGLDIIDKLDVTGIYGQGLFHHDGPFDACNPHRNSKRDRRAPMQAFPANSANMQLGGSGPINTQIDLDRFHGRGEQAFDAFNTARKPDAVIVDPTSRVEAIHGDETYGLGTSTFLEGAPASKKDIQRKDSDEFTGVGLSRKKSLAQKFRGMSSGRPSRPIDLRSPDTKYNGDVFDASPPPMVRGAVSAGGIAQATSSKETEFNPFDNDYENAYEKKGAQIKIAEQERTAGRARAPSSPKGRGLVRTVTADSTDPSRPDSNEGEGSKTGFLSRMKSLKGGKRTKPEGRES